MSPGPTAHDIRFFATAGDLRDWFDANHATESELWLGYQKKGSGTASVTWSEAVDEALCVGWIDGLIRGIDERTYCQRFTPRRKGSNWSAVNVAKVASLSAESRMRPAGAAAFEARRDDRTAVYSYERDTTELTHDETAAFRAKDAAWADWEGRPVSYRKSATYWVTSARRPETRARRLATLIDDCATGRKVRQLTPPSER